MAKIDKAKEEIGWLKLLFTLFFGTFIPLIVWVLRDPSEYVSFIKKILDALPYLSLPDSVIWSAVVASVPIVLMVGYLFVLIHGIRWRINELERL